MSNPDYKRISKFLSYVLRHHPERINVELDRNGWADIDAVIRGANQEGVELDFLTLLHVVETNEKQRFKVSYDQSKIRASQGHSVDVELGYPVTEPPEVLYHGTSARALPLILEEGLVKRKRSHVHLSADTHTAYTVGMRHGKPIVLKVAAKEMFNAGFEFYLSDNFVWLTDKVPVLYIEAL